MPENHDLPALRRIRVVVASPADTLRERQKALLVLRELNEWFAPALGFTLLPVMWERHAYPAVDEEGPQGHIDRVLDIDNCDLLVGIFRTHFGDAMNGRESGTEHEIRKAHERWSEFGRPQLMLYFLDKPQVMSDEDVEGLRKIIEFRASLPHALYWRYRPSTFSRIFRDHLMLWLRSIAAQSATEANTQRSPASEALDVETALSELRGMLESLRRDLESPVLLDRLLFDLFLDRDKLTKLKDLLELSFTPDDDAPVRRALAALRKKSSE